MIIFVITESTVRSFSNILIEYHIEIIVYCYDVATCYKQMNLTEEQSLKIDILRWVSES